MLSFRGIHLIKGTPQRFRSRFDLFAYAHAVKAVLAEHSGRCDLALQTIADRINAIYGDASGVLSAEQRTAAFALHRQKDIITFLHDDNLEYRTTKKMVFEALLHRTSIAKKWQIIEAIILRSESVFPPEQLLQDCARRGSLLRQILELTQLFFMEQTDEEPPEHMLLKVSSHRFPEHYWVVCAQSDTQPYRQEHFSAWEPENVFCRLAYMVSAIAQKHARMQGDTPGVTSIASAAVSGVEDQQSETQGAEHLGDSVLIYEDEDADDQTLQLQLFCNRPTDTLLQFQEHLAKKLGAESVLHYLAFLRQLAAQKDAQQAMLSLPQHFALLQKHPHQAYPSTKKLLAYRVLQEMQKLMVVRKKERDTGTYLYKSPLLLNVQQVHENHIHARPVSLALRCDAIIRPNQGMRPFHLGAPLLLIHDDLFKEKISSGLVLLAAYMANVWLYEYPQHKGICTKSIIELAKGSGLSLSKNSHYRTLRKIRSGLQKMKEHSYIEEYRLLTQDEHRGTVKAESYRVYASPATITRISNLYAQRGEWTPGGHLAEPGMRPILGE